MNKLITHQDQDGNNLYPATVRAQIADLETNVVQTTQPVGGMLPNLLYAFGTISTDTTFALATPTDNTIINLYFWTFDIGSTVPNITFPTTGITKWEGGSAPTVQANKHYEVAVLGGVAFCKEV